jgi:hypothetical protein
MLRSLIGTSVLAVVAGLLLSQGSPVQAEASGSEARLEPEHRALRAALYHLKEAREEVKDERFKRHRERVEKDLKIAIIEVERALKEGKIEVKYEPAKGWDAKYKSFKHLHQALIELDAAKKDIREEKGAWARRKELLEAINDAHLHIDEALKEIK